MAGYGVDMSEPEQALTTVDQPPEGSMQRIIDQWTSGNPPWDPDVLERIDELAWRLPELRARGDA